VGPPAAAAEPSGGLAGARSGGPAGAAEIAADPGRLGEEIPYVNSLGEAWTNRAGDLLEHAVLHGVYHRGQIAAALRRAGCEPAYTDFVHAVRRGFVV
jgi:uncharacterized damage-inducible protein DinB